MDNKCLKCGTELELAWRVFNWADDLSDKYFEKEKQARNYFNKCYEDTPMLGWRLYEHKYCPKCDTDEEELIEFGEE